MASPDKFATAFCRALRRLGGAEAASMVEFAVALPLLIVLVVGIFDFGAAFNMKQELNNAMREGARFGAAQPTNDLYNNTSVPPSVSAIRAVVDSYMQTAKINDCGLATASGFSPRALTWQYTATAPPCTGKNTLQLTIWRGCAQLESLPGVTGQVNLLCTQIQIRYPFQWRFSDVTRLLVQGAKPWQTNIQTQATAVNMD